MVTVTVTFDVSDGVTAAQVENLRDAWAAVSEGTYRTRKQQEQEVSRAFHDGYRDGYREDDARRTRFLYEAYQTGHADGRAIAQREAAAMARAFIRSQAVRARRADCIARNVDGLPEADDWREKAADRRRAIRVALRDTGHHRRV